MDEGIVQPEAKAAEFAVPPPPPTEPVSRPSRPGNCTSACQIRRIRQFLSLCLPATCGRLTWAQQERRLQLPRQLTVGEAAYLAGIVDGEGTITLTRMHRGENRRPVVSISSTELPLLLYVKSVVGAGRITRKACVRSCHTPSYAYILLRPAGAPSPASDLTVPPHVQGGAGPSPAAGVRARYPPQRQVYGCSAKGQADPRRSLLCDIDKTNKQSKGPYATPEPRRYC